MSAPRNVRQWYHKHGVPLREEDWGERFENGESADAARATNWYGQPNADNWRTRLLRFDIDWAGWYDTNTQPLWSPREDREMVERMEAFFAPYIAMLPFPKGNIIRQLFNDRLTYAEAAEDAQLTRQGAYAATRRAVRALTRLVANDDPDFVPPADGRRRDYDAERAAAWRVFDRYMRRQDGQVGGVRQLHSDDAVRGPGPVTTHVPAVSGAGASGAGSPDAGPDA